MSTAGDQDAMALACQRGMRRIKVSVGITDTRQLHLSLIHRPQTTGSVNNMVQMAASRRWEPYLVISLASVYVMMTSGLDSTTNRRLLRSVETTNIYGCGCGLPAPESVTHLTKEPH